MQRLNLLRAPAPILATILATMLAACAAAPPRAAVTVPELRLAPSALGHELSVQQRLHFSFGQQQRDLDALLEVDAQEVRLAVQALGQSGVRLSWDGTELQQQRAPWLPPSVRGERVLSDLQFTLWPADAIRAALPAPWTLNEDGHTRRLERDGIVWLQVDREGPGRYLLDNRAEGYRLQIESVGQEVEVP
ncbi:DUF3261 domain-containing protein [Lysobacter niastensis]|uniref:DUF3261 domain-containing protein n=1 Tax=Lysobacter niastensis TaxID=380629 RepID=A0ABS0B470_9GAMM|nr:DUF3261 domain-containing protein [Lysobacter niastensis]MBF6023356.1 DUF3261 domain-containing protein [Lysobacter niastensis]